MPVFFSVLLSLLGSASGTRERAEVRLREMEGRREQAEGQNWRKKEPGQRGSTASEPAFFLFNVVCVCVPVCR